MARNRLPKATRRSGLTIQLKCKVRCGEEQMSEKQWEFSARLTMQQHWATIAVLTFSATETRNQPAEWRGQERVRKRARIDSRKKEGRRKGESGGAEGLERKGRGGKGGGRGVGRR